MTWMNAGTVPPGLRGPPLRRAWTEAGPGRRAGQDLAGHELRTYGRGVRVRRILGRAMALGLTAVVVDATVRTPRRLRVHDVPLAVPGWPAELDGLRVAVVGDLHAGAPAVGLARLTRVVQQVVDAQPDLVVLLGDHLADVWLGSHLEPEPVAEVLAGLLAAAPVVGVLGNHDWYAGGHRVRARAGRRRAARARGVGRARARRAAVGGRGQRPVGAHPVGRAGTGRRAGRRARRAAHAQPRRRARRPAARAARARRPHPRRAGPRPRPRRPHDQRAHREPLQRRLVRRPSGSTSPPASGPRIAPVRTVLPEVPVLVLGPA